MKRTYSIAILLFFLCLTLGSAWALPSDTRPDTELSRRKVIKNQTEDKKKKKKGSEEKSKESSNKKTSDKSSEPTKQSKPPTPSTPAVSDKKTSTTPAPQNQSLPPKGPTPLNVFADIEEGWRRHDVGGMLRHFGKGKVSLSIGGAGPKGGYFSRNQSYYLFKDLFKYTITKKFEFVQYRNIDNDKKKVYAVAERYYKRRDDGRLYKDKIYVSLNREGSQWVISEIKSIR